MHISIPKKALEAIFDECDRFDVDETGGKVVGMYQKKGREYFIDVLGIIDAGPNAKRSPTSLFQDGEYQERVFRSIEKEYPDLEHLGSWHSHHVNGLSTLSSGDRVTYHNIVNHPNHNTDFFYALLVVQKTPNREQRYEIKHYLVFRNDDSLYEIPKSQVHVLEQSQCRRTGREGSFAMPCSSHETELVPDANLERVRDQEFFSEFFPSLKPGFSKSLGTLYWKGRLPLVDGSHTEVLAMESSSNGKRLYSITLSSNKPLASEALGSYDDRSFNSARAAVLSLERDVNRELYRAKKG